MWVVSNMVEKLILSSSILELESASGFLCSSQP